MLVILFLEPLGRKVASLVILKISIVQIEPFEIITFDKCWLVANHISQKHMVVRSDQKVVWLDISMYHLLIMDLADCAKNLENKPLLLHEYQGWNFVEHSLPETVVHVLAISVEHWFAICSKHRLILRILDFVHFEDQDIGMLPQIKFLNDSAHFVHEIGLVVKERIVGEKLVNNLALVLFEAHQGNHILSVTHRFRVAESREVFLDQHVRVCEQGDLVTHYKCVRLINIYYTIYNI